MKIEDGSGKGYLVRVDSNNRLRTKAITESEAFNATENGNSYNINTGLISISGDATLLYFENTGDSDYVLEAIALGEFEGITHSDDPYITVVSNPTGGDLISDATAVDINQNRNIGSSKSLSANVYKGKVGGTLTGGNNAHHFPYTINWSGRSFFTFSLLIPKGSSIGIKLTANVTSGSANLYCALIGHEYTV